MQHVNLPSLHQGADLRAIEECIHHDDYAQLSEKFSFYLSGKSDHYEVSYRVKTAGGKWLWVLDRGKVTDYDDSGKPIRVSGTIKDISLIKASEQALAQLNKTLEARVEQRTESLRLSRDELQSTLEELKATQSVLIEAQKMASLGRLVTGVSHELNTPLGNILTANSILLQELNGFKEKLEAKQLTLTDTKTFVDMSFQVQD